MACGPMCLHASAHARPLRRVALDVHAAAGRDQRRGFDAEHRRDLLLQRVERLDRRHPDGRADARGGRAAAGQRADAVVGVADLRRDPLGRQSQGVGGDNGNQRARAGAEVLRADAHDDAAVGGNLAVGLRRSATAAAPRADRHAHARLERTGCGIARRVALAPAEGLCAFLQVRTPHRVRCFRRQVLDAELDRVHLHQVGELVHHDFGDERPLRVPRRAHRPLQARVGEHVLVRAPPIGDAVDVRQREPGSRSRAAGTPGLGIERRDEAVGRHTRLDASGGGRPVPDGEVLFLAVQHQLDGLADLSRQLRADQALGADAERLAAEAAAHVLALHPDVGLWQVQRRGEVFARGVDALRRDPHRQLVALPLADRAVRLQADVRDDVGLVGLFEGVRGSGEASRQVAGLLRLPLAHVAVREHGRRRTRERQRHVGHVRQHLVLHLHQARGVDRLLLGVGDDGCHFVALEHDAVGWLGAGLPVHQATAHTWRLERRRQIHGDHPRMRMRRADDPRIQHARTVDVEGVPGASGDLVGTVEALDRRAEHGPCLGPGKFRIEGRLRCGGWPTCTFARRSWHRVLLSHADLLPRSRPPRRCAGTCRSGRCCRRGPCGSARAWRWDASRAVRRSP